MAKQKKVKFVSANKYIGLNGQKPNMSANGRFNYDTPEEYKKKKSGIRFMSPEEYNEQKHIQAYKNQLEYYEQRQKQERERKEKMNALSSRNTDVWRNNAVSDTAKTGNTFKTYQGKMQTDTHGGLSGQGYYDYLNSHPTPEMKRTDAWRKLDKTAKYSPELKDESAYIAKMMYDSHTQTPTQSKYIPGGQQRKKKETAADKTGQSMGDYLAGIKQKKEEKTKQTDWQAQTAHAQNSADPWGKYAEVYEQKAKSGNASQKTTDDWKKATQASTLLADNPNLAYGAKMAGVTPDEFVQQLQETNKQLTQQEQKDNRAASLIKGKTDLGHWLGGTTEDVQQTMRAGYASGFRTDYDRLKEQGYFDEGEDPYLMSDEGRANWRAKNEAESAAYQAKIDELTAQAEGMTPLNTDRERQARLLEAYVTPEIENELTIINGAGYTEEEKKNARIRLQELRSEAAYGASEFLKSGFLSMVNDKSQLPVVRRELYDAMYGRGAYEKATAGMTEEERAALDGRLDDTYYAVSDPYGVVGKDLRTYKAMLENAQGQIAMIDRLTQQDAKYAEMMEGVDELGDVQIDPATVGTSRNSLLQNQYTPAAPVEYVAAILSGDYNEDVWINDLQYGQALLMSDDEKKKFADLYNNGKKNEAWAFYQGLEPMLNQMYHYFEDLSIRQTARRIPITSSIATEAMHLAQPVEALINLPEQLASAVFDTGSGVTDPYSSRYLVTRLKNGIRAQVSEDVGDWDWVYNGFTSGVDSALNVSIGKALGLDGKFLNIAGQKIPAMQAATLALFHTQAFETSLQNTMTQGNDQFGYDFIEAWIDAAVETATEIWSVENWMADPTNILRYVGKIAISEPSEEIVGAIIEPYIKEMLGHKNQYKERAKQILADGGYTDGQGNWVKVEDMDTATRQAMREWNHDIRMAAQEALLSVGPSIVYGSARMATDTNRTGRAIQSNNINGEQNATRELAEAAARMNPETESYKQSQKMLERLKSGEQISNYDAGKLATNIIRETNEQIGNTARQVLQDRVAEDLQSKGMQAEEAQEYAGLITSALEEGGIDNLTQKQRSKINGNNAALQTYMSYRFSAETRNKTAKAQLEATQGDRQSRFTVEALMMDRKTNDNLDVGEQMSTEQERKEAQGKVAQGTMGIVYNQQNARLGSMVLDADGKQKYQVFIEGQKEPVLADSTEIRANHMGTAAIIQSQATNPEFYSQGFTNVLLQAMNDKRMENKPGILMRDAMLLRYAAYEQMEQVKTELPADIARNLYEYSQAEYIARRAADTQNAKRSKLQPGQGYATYKGYRSGSAEFDKALKQSGLSKADQQYVRMISDLAKAMGAELTLTDNAEIVNSQNGELAQFKQDPSKLYGAEKGSRITVNLGGMNFARNAETGRVEATGQRHNVVVTFGHEAVHFLQENTREGFDNLAQYVLNEQRSKLGTQGLNDRLDQIMHSQNVDLYGAISELVADSCDNIFTSQEVIDHIQQTNKGLYQNLKNFAKNLITRLRNAITSSMSADSKRLGNQVGSRMAKLFNLAWDEAASRELVYDEKAYQRAQATVEKLGMNVNTEARFSQHTFNGEDYILIDNPAFNGRANVTQNDLKNYLSKHINDVSTIIESGQKVYIGKQLPGEYAFSKNTGYLRKNNADAYTTKANAASQIGELIEIAKNRRPEKAKHAGASKAKYGVYRYDTILAMKLKNGYKAYYADLIVLNFADGTKDLYDVIFTKENTALAQHLDKKAGVAKAISSKQRLAQNNQNSKPKLSRAQTEKNTEGVDGYPNAIDTGKMGNQNPSVIDSIAETVATVNDDAAYREAVERGDLAAATRMLMDKLKSVDGVIPFMAPEWHAGESQKIAENLKNNDPEAIRKAAEAMAKVVPDNAVLIPMPGRNGIVEEGSWIMNLTNRIAELTGRPVVVALEGQQRESRQEAKHDNRKGVSQEELGFRVVEEIPEGTLPIFIDNTVGTGITADAARIAMGGGITLAYTKTLRSPGIIGLKNVLVTYESKKNGGALIPLSQRFDVSKRDVRYSRAQMDSEYMAAVESGDKQTQQRILDEAARRNGYTMKVYHGTPTGGFTVFRDWSYFTEKKEYADRYNHPSQSSTRGYAVDATQPMTYELYMNPGRVFDTRNSKEAKLFEQIRMEYGMSQLTDNGLPDWTDGRDLIEYIEENNLPYDTIILNEGADGGYGAPVVSRGESYVSRSNMVKSAELVTRDDEGNVIPPSERFNKQKNDIRFSMAQPVEQTRNLIAVHNLTEQNLIDTLAEGGFTAPSIAVIRAATGHSKFGEISVIFNKDS